MIEEDRTAAPEGNTKRVKRETEGMELEYHQFETFSLRYDFSYTMYEKEEKNIVANNLREVY